MEILVNENAENYMDFYGISVERSEYLKQKMVEIFAENIEDTEPGDFVQNFIKAAIPRKPDIEKMKVRLLRNCDTVNELIWCANFYDTVQYKFANHTRRLLEEVLSELQ